MLLLAIYRPTARICTEDDLLKLDFGLQMFQKMEVTASNWKYEFQPTSVYVVPGRIPLFEKLLQRQRIFIILIIDVKIVVCTFAQ